MQQLQGYDRLDRYVFLNSTFIQCDLLLNNVFYSPSQRLIYYNVSFPRDRQRMQSQRISS
jgi:hypothetical protein